MFQRIYPLILIARSEKDVRLSLRFKVVHSDCECDAFRSKFAEQEFVFSEIKTLESLYLEKYSQPLIQTELPSTG